MEEAMSGRSGFRASQMPIKSRVKNIAQMSQQFTKMMNENKKESQILRSECASLEHRSTEMQNEIMKEILDDIANLEKAFRKIQGMDLNDSNSLKQQATQLVMEKTTLKQATVLLDNRVANIEHEVGFE